MTCVARNRIPNAWSIKTDIYLCPQTMFHEKNVWTIPNDLWDKKRCKIISTTVYNFHGWCNRLPQETLWSRVEFGRLALSGWQILIVYSTQTTQLYFYLFIYLSLTQHESNILQIKIDMYSNGKTKQSLTTLRTIYVFSWPLYKSYERLVLKSNKQ